MKARPRKEITSTIECSGSNGLPFAQSMIGNATWAGASLSETLQAAGIKDDGIEVVFYGIAFVEHLDAREPFDIGDTRTSRAR